MSSIRKLALYREALLLRNKGKTYSEIELILGVSKSTQSYWFSGKGWSEVIRKKNYKYWHEKNKEKFIKYIQNRKSNTEKRHLEYRRQAKKDFDKLLNDPLFLVGLSLYWAEGSKTQKNRIATINTDVNLLKIVLKFYLEILKVPLEKIRVEIFSYPDHRPSQLLTYWSRELGISKAQFIKIQVLSSRSKNTKRKLNHGICSVYCSNTEKNIKICEWIRLLGLHMRD